MVANIISILGFLIYIAVMAMPLQGLDILGGEMATVGAEVMLRFHAVIFIVSTLLNGGALVANFLKKPAMKMAGLSIAVASIILALGFVLYLERGFNLLQIGYIIAPILLLVGNLLAERD